MISALSNAMSALAVLEKKVDVTANNIANVNTEGFKKSRAVLQETAEGGVRVTLQKVDTPGMPVPSEESPGELEESSNVDLGEEFVDLIVSQRAYEANVKTVQAEDERLKSLVDILA